jgi:DNA-binding PucR family transcriptional regulator
MSKKASLPATATPTDAPAQRQPARIALSPEPPPFLELRAAARVYVAELAPDAPPHIRASNAAIAVGRSRREALRLGDFSAAAMPWLSTVSRWLIDKDADSILFTARWLQVVDLPVIDRERAHAALAFDESPTAALERAFAAIDREEGAQPES